MEVGDTVALAAAVVALFLGQFAFRVQRVGLNLSRMFCSRCGLPRSAQNTLHYIFTPKWVVPLDSTGKVMVLAVMGWLAYAYWWVWSLCYFVVAWAIGLALDLVNPWPSVNSCLRWSWTRLESGDHAQSSSEAQQMVQSPEWQQMIQAARDLVDDCASQPERDVLRRL